MYPKALAGWSAHGWDYRAQEGNLLGNSTKVSNVDWSNLSMTKMFYDHIGTIQEMLANQTMTCPTASSCKPLPFYLSEYGTNRLSFNGKGVEYPTGDWNDADSNPNPKALTLTLALRPFIWSLETGTIGDKSS